MPGPPLDGNLVAGGDVDDVDREIGKLGRKRRGQIVAAGFDQHQIEIGKFRAHLGDRGEIDRGVLANGGVRAAAGFHAGDAIGGERARAHQIFGVPLGVDVVGDGGDFVSVAQLLAQQIHQRGLAGADRAADADAQGSVRIGAARGLHRATFSFRQHPRKRHRPYSLRAPGSRLPILHPRWGRWSAGRRQGFARPL